MTFILLLIVFIPEVFAPTRNNYVGDVRVHEGTGLNNDPVRIYMTICKPRDLTDQELSGLKNDFRGFITEFKGNVEKQWFEYAIDVTKTRKVLKGYHEKCVNNSYINNETLDSIEQINCYDIPYYTDEEYSVKEWKELTKEDINEFVQNSPIGTCKKIRHNIVRKNKDLIESFSGDAYIQYIDDGGLTNYTEYINFESGEYNYMMSINISCGNLPCSNYDNQPLSISLPIANMTLTQPFNASNEIKIINKTKDLIPFSWIEGHNNSDYVDINITFQSGEANYTAFFGNSTPSTQTDLGYAGGEHVIRDEDLGIYHFNENTGSITYDKSSIGNSITGVTTNSNLTAGGVFGGMAHFGGTCGEFNNDTFMDYVTKGSMSFYIRDWKGDWGSYIAEFYGRADSSDNDIGRGRISDDTKMYFIGSANDGYPSHSTDRNSWQQNEWYHILFEWNSTGNDIWINGNFDSTSSNVIDFSDITDTFKLGCRGLSTLPEPLKFEIDELVVSEKIQGTALCSGCDVNFGDIHQPVINNAPNVTRIELFNSTTPYGGDTIMIRCIGYDPDITDANATLLVAGDIKRPDGIFDNLSFNYTTNEGWEADYVVKKSGYHDAYCNLTDIQGATGDKTVTNLFYALNNPPILAEIDDFFINEDFGAFDLNLSNNASDVEDTNFTWIVSSSNTSAATVSIVNLTNILTLTSVANASGATNISVWLYDSQFDSDFDSFVLTVNPVNDPPYIINYNASSDTKFYDNEFNVTFEENESSKFSVLGKDIDSLQIWYSWFLDGVNQLVDTLQGWLDWVPSFFDSGVHNITVYINDSEGLIAYQEWIVNIMNVNNPNFAINFVEPTPDDGETIHTDYVDVRVEIEGPEAEAPEFVRLFENYEDFTGSFNKTFLNNTFIQLEGENVSGDYVSNVFDAGGDVVWDNLSWEKVLPVNGETIPDENTTLLFHLNNDSAYGENDNFIYDFSSNGNNGTAYGANPTPDGNLSGGFEFGGINDYVNCGNDVSLDVTSEATWEAWVYLNQHKATSSEDGQVLMSKQESGAGERQYVMFLGQSSDWKNLIISIRKEDDSGWVKAIDAAYFPVKQWVLVTATYNKSASPSLKLYRNGVQVASDNSYHGDIQTGGNKPLTIGSLSVGGWFFNGTLDEVSIWNRALTGEEISSHANATYLIGGIKFQARSCDDAGCSGESFVGPSGDVSQYYTEPSYNDISSDVIPNQYFQYKAFLETNVAGKSPEFYNVTVEGETVVEAEGINIDSVWVDWNGVNYTMSNVSASEWQTTITGLSESNYNYKAYANDSYDNSNLTETRTVTVKTYDINFSVVDSWTGELLTGDINSIDCSNGLSDTFVSNPVGPYDFFQGFYECNFTKDQRYDKQITFTSNNNKIVDVPMAEKYRLTDEEHAQLDWLYNCWNEGDCWNLLQYINQTTTRIWQKVTKSDHSVIIKEDILSNTLSISSNITVNYTINVPYKQGYNNGELLPLRIFFWFTNPEGTICLSQDKTVSNRAEYPYCIPLMAETLVPNNGSVSFIVDLRPDIPEGTYNFTRAVEIDPIENGMRNWINYGQEDIGQVKVTKANTENPLIHLIQKRVDYGWGNVKRQQSLVTELSSGMQGITGNVVKEQKIVSKNFWIGMLVALFIIVTILNIILFLKWNKGAPPASLLLVFFL